VAKIYGHRYTLRAYKQFGKSKAQSGTSEIMPEDSGKFAENQNELI
jgi:hypothetical protein